MTEELQPFSYQGMADLMKGVFSYYGFDPKPLADQPLAGVAVSDDKERITFTLADGRDITYTAEGDCCSHSWIEHLTVPPDIAGAVIDAIAERQMGETVNDDEWETIRVYETSFRTAKGEIVIEYRNSSNGYYGGYLSGPV